MRPTPETDAFFATFADGEAAPSHAEYYARLQDLERERDEARDAANKAKAYKRVLKESNAQLKRERDEARAEMIRWMSIAEGRGHTDETLSNQ